MAEVLKFYDVKKKKSFTTANYKVVVKSMRNGKRRFAVAKSPLSGIMAYRVMGR